MKSAIRKDLYQSYYFCRPASGSLAIEIRRWRCRFSQTPAAVQRKKSAGCANPSATGRHIRLINFFRMKLK
ncbi:MAG: hypothetical protein KME26_28890 [Oscillatoria princeps RMCB-10]|nr:hypothetical protein [Oscillatoria princeps RMCB-10]